MAKSQKKNAGTTPWKMPAIPGAMQSGMDITPPPDKPKKPKKKPAKKKV